MESLRRKLFCSDGFSRRNQRNSQDRRRFCADVEQVEFQYASSYCFSSYYSVFVVRLAIMALLAILIGLLTILTWHFTRVYTTKSLNTLAFGLRYELLQRPLLRMWNILNSTSEITTAQVKLAEYVIRRYTTPLPSAQSQQVELYETMRDVTWALFASRKALNAITINYRNGFVQAFHRDHRSSNTFYIYSDLVNYSISNSYDMSMVASHQNRSWNDQSIQGNLSAIWYREPVDPLTGQKIGKPTPIPPDELTNIAGPSQVPDGTASWHVAVSKYTDGSPLLSTALPVWDPSNKSIVAVVGVTTALYSVGQLMKEIVEYHSGHIYLTSKEGYLLATSTDAPLLRNASTGPKLVMAVDSEDDVISEGAQWLQKYYPKKFPPNHDVHVENAKLGGRTYYIDSFFLSLKRLPMAGVIIIPREYIMGKVDRRAFKTFVILISASVCTLIIGCVCILILTNGVSKEMKLRAELISQLEARRRAEASSNYKSQFLANMSHELRTPMAAVIGLLDILICDDCLTNEQYATVTQIRKCSNALLRLLNNILDLSKVESGKLVLEEAEFDLGRELEGLIDMFSVQCINHNVETILDLSDDMPRLVRGDSARVVQIFANLISNSIKFTPNGHVILRGWCEKSNTYSNMGSLPYNHRDRGPASVTNSKQQWARAKDECKRDNKVILWFEVDDTGCGIDPSKWESVFESFEQADPSTTRKHGGTGLGLCIVRTLVNKMGGEIKIVKKNGTGTLMQLCLLLGTPTDSMGQALQTEFADHNLVVLLAIGGNTGRLITSQWLQAKGVFTWQASDWNELAQILKRVSEARSSLENDTVSSISLIELPNDEPMNIDLRAFHFIFVIDISLLDLSTNIWKEQLNFLGRYAGKATLAWVLNHDTSNSIKMELRRRGHFLMVNKPLYKTKMTQILEAVVKQRKLELQEQCLEIDPIRYDGTSSDDSDKAEPKTKEKKQTRIRKPSFTQFTSANNYVIDFDEDCSQNDVQDDQLQGKRSSSGQYYMENCHEKKSLEGLSILLAEDTPVLQRVATIMLEKMGARVIVVGDGVQAVNALKCSINGDVNEKSLPFDAVLMDCQMPKMDGYEATKEIRKIEEGSGSHIPIVALTAHAMSCDEAKCLEVGMDAYLTKPIDYNLMVSTILSLTRKVS